jgi:tellurite resistance protein
MSIARLFEGGERKQQRGHLQNIVLLAMSDGNISDVELLFIHKMGRKIGLTNTQIGNILDNPRDLEIIPPSNKLERAERMVEMVSMVQSDGVLSPDELNMLSRFALLIGYRSVEEVNVNLIIRNLRAKRSVDEIAAELAR